MMLGYLATSVSKGGDAREDNQKIDKSSYAWHAFPLPWMEKVSSNPMEQENPSLFPIHEYSHFYLLVELWYCIQANLKEGQDIATTWEELLTDMTLISHDMNLKTYRH